MGVESSGARSVRALAPNVLGFWFASHAAFASASDDPEPMGPTPSCGMDSYVSSCADGASDAGDEGEE